MTSQSQKTNPFKAKKRRWGERIAEFSIKITASLSIIVIFLILIFILREAAGIAQYFFPSQTELTIGSEQTSPSKALSESDDADQEPESYGVGDETDANVPETYGETTDIAASDDNMPEVYNPDSGEIPQPWWETPEPIAVSHSSSLAENLVSDVWQPVSSEPKYGLIPLLAGTAKTTALAIAIAAPLAVFAALYAAFFAPRRLREIIKPIVELVAGFPSVVIGFFCMMIVADFVQDTFEVEYRINALVGGIGLSIAIIPVIFTITEDSLSAVPASYREASLALGATEWETAFKVMLPAALPGVVAAILLGVGRAFGETMIALMATGNAALMSSSIFAPVRTMAATIGAEMGEVIWGSLHYNVLYLIGVLLFIVSLCINAATEFVVKGMLARKFQGTA